MEDIKPTDDRHPARQAAHAAIACLSMGSSAYIRALNPVALAIHETVLAERESHTWKPIYTAPKDGTVIDVWLVSENEDDIMFYCQQPPVRIVDGSFAGRSAGWCWQQDKFRPYLPGLMMPTFIQPTHWISIPKAPSERE